MSMRLNLFGNHGISKAFPRSLPIYVLEEIVLACASRRFGISQAEGHVLSSGTERLQVGVVETGIRSDFPRVRIIKLCDLDAPLHFWRYHFDYRGSGIEKAVGPFWLIVCGSRRNLNMFCPFRFQGWKEHIRGISAKTEIVADIATRSQVGCVFPLLGEFFLLEAQGSSARLVSIILAFWLVTLLGVIVIPLDVGEGRLGVGSLPAAVDALVLHLDGFGHRLLVYNIVERSEGAREVLAVVNLWQKSSATYFFYVCTLVGILHKNAVWVLHLVHDVLNRPDTCGWILIFRLDPVCDGSIRIRVNLHGIDLAPTWVVIRILHRNFLYFINI